MGGKSAIEWTEATWNPVVGCSIVSPGCTNCYAMAMAARIQKMNRTGGSGSDYVNHYDGTTRSVNGKIVWTGKLALAPPKIFNAPLSRKKPTTWFVNSMGDLFHDDVPDEWIDRVFAVMALTPQHTFQVLTKRAKRMRGYLTDEYTKRRVWASTHDFKDFCEDVRLPLHVRSNCDAFSAALAGLPWPLPNVWLGVSAERQQEADERIPVLLQTPAAVRFISAEPLLGPIVLHPLGDGTNALTSSTGPNLSWVIVGGESGPKARPLHPEWVRSLRDQCAALPSPSPACGGGRGGGAAASPDVAMSGDTTRDSPNPNPPPQERERERTAFFFKQWGEWAPSTPDQAQGNPRSGWRTIKAHPHVARAEELYPETGAAFIERVGKARAGRLLDGVEHNGFPTRGASNGV